MEIYSERVDGSEGSMVGKKILEKCPISLKNFWARCTTRRVGEAK